VPGVVLLDNVLQCIEDQISTDTSERVESRIKITAAKFLQPVLPEQLVRLEISVKPDKFDFLGSVSGIPVVSGSSKFVTEQVT